MAESGLDAIAPQPAHTLRSKGAVSGGPADADRRLEMGTGWSRADNSECCGRQRKIGGRNCLKRLRAPDDADVGDGWVEGARNSNAKITAITSRSRTLPGGRHGAGVGYECNSNNNGNGHSYSDKLSPLVIGSR